MWIKNKDSSAWPLFVSYLKECRYSYINVYSGILHRRYVSRGFLDSLHLWHFRVELFCLHSHLFSLFSWLSQFWAKVRRYKLSLNVVITKFRNSFFIQYSIAELTIDPLWSAIIPGVASAGRLWESELLANHDPGMLGVEAHFHQVNFQLDEHMIPVQHVN